MIAAVDATKETAVGKRFKIEGYPTGNWVDQQPLSDFLSQDLFTPLVCKCWCCLCVSVCSCCLTKIKKPVLIGKFCKWIWYWLGPCLALVFSHLELEVLEKQWSFAKAFFYLNWLPHIFAYVKLKCDIQTFNPQVWELTCPSTNNVFPSK